MLTYWYSYKKLLMLKYYESRQFLSNSVSLDLHVFLLCRVFKPDWQKNRPYFLNKGVLVQSGMICKNEILIKLLNIVETKVYTTPPSSFDARVNVYIISQSVC